MINDSAYKTPGQLVHALILDRGWTKRVLSIVLGVDESIVSKVIAGKRAVDAAMALSLAEVFDTSAERFLDLQKSYDLAQAKIVARPDPGRATRACLFGDLPVSEMIQRGWLDVDDVRHVEKVETALVKFFGVKSVAEIEILPHAAKKTNTFQPASPAQLAWIYRVKEIASEMLVGRFSTSGMKECIARLEDLLSAPEEARKAPRILAEYGVRFVIVETLASAKIDGVCFWLNDLSPVIGMSLRHDRIDNFWFVLRHECEHILRGHGKAAVMLDTELEGDRAGTGSSVLDEERVANEAAANFCVPQKTMDSFIARKSPFFREQDLLGMARTLQIHPGLVAGQLQRRIGRYDLFRKHLVKIRSVVVPSAMSDGWGDVAPVGL
jgi:HTH-type transcriptional regulator/antitoxin HigA